MSQGAYQLRPWTDVVRPHPDVASGDLAMGTYAANLATVTHGGEGPSVYAQPTEFFAATYFTEAMRELLGDVFGVLSDSRGNRVIQLRTPFGGGKTHTLLALYHLAAHRGAAANVPELAEVPDLGEVRVAVLSGEYLDPQRPRRVDGRSIATLWGELAYQLGGWEGYESILVDGEEGVPPGGEVLARLLVGTPTLLLLDEVLIYVVKGRGVKRIETTAGQQTIIFLHNLTEAINQQPHAAMVYSLQASVGEAVQEEGLLEILEKISARIDTRREPVSGDEVLGVLQRRLFEDVGEEAVRADVARAYARLLRDQLEAAAETDDQRREAEIAASNLERRIVDAYPFHPELIDLMYLRWGSLPSYQRTRGALQFLATVVHSIWASRGEREPQALIGPGDVDLADEATRATFFEQVGEATQYTSVVEADFLSADAGTRVVDERLGRDAPGLERLRAATRVATAIMLLSFGAREGEDRGALDHDVITASLVPDLDGNVLRSALDELRGEALLYLHYTGRRYRFEPTPNLNKLIAGEQEKFTSEEVLDQVRRELEAALGARGAASEIVLWPEGSAQIPDDVPSFLVAYLPPGWDEGAQPPARLIAEHGESPRRHRNGLSLVLPHAPTMDAARQAARAAMAIESLLARKGKLGFSPEQTDELKERLASAARKLSSVLGQAYDRVIFASALDERGEIVIEVVDLGTILAAGRGLHERVRDALATHVFDSLTPARLAVIAKLGECRVAWCEELSGSFYRYFELTKLWSLEPLRAAISLGVEDGDFAYAVGVSEEAEVQVENPALIRFRAALPADQIDLGPGAALLSPAVAVGLRPEAQPAGGDESEETATEPGAGTADGQEPAQVGLHISATDDDLHTLQVALSGLREITTRGSMRIELKVVASNEEGPIDRIQYQNRVRQHLEEDPDVAFEERWE